VFFAFGILNIMYLSSPNALFCLKRKQTVIVVGNQFTTFMSFVRSERVRVRERDRKTIIIDIIIYRVVILFDERVAFEGND
jgi:hypothetical protein